MSENDTNQVSEQPVVRKFLYSYTEEQINAVLTYLGEFKAKEVNHLINALKSPVKVEEIKD